MKKVVTIFLAFIVALSSLGFSLTIGYCPMAKTHSYSLAGKSSCCCETEDHQGCCESHKVNVKKVDSNYLTSSIVSINAQNDFVVFENPTLSQNSIYSFVNQNLFRQNFDPPEPNVPLNILYRSILV